MKFGSCKWNHFLETDHTHRHTDSHTHYFIIGIDYQLTEMNEKNNERNLCKWYRFLVTEHTHRHTDSHAHYFVIGI